MRGEKPGVRLEKEEVRDQVEIAFRIMLPVWLVEGTTIEELRWLQRTLREAHARYIQAGGIPVVDERSP